MYEIKPDDEITMLNSLSLFIGTGKCNARCCHCAGEPLRKYAPQKDGIIDETLIYKTLKSCYEKGARSLSISSSGEPTLSPLSVTKALNLVYECSGEGINYSPINIYSNGIRIGNDSSFCDTYLPLWKNYGLTFVYVTVHNIDEKKNAEIYGVNNYPSLDVILNRIHNAGLLVRANLILSKKTTHTHDEFISTVTHLLDLNVDKISAWSIRSLDDKVDLILSPNEQELNKMEEWLNTNNVTNKVKILREKNRIVYQTGTKLTLFPDGTISNTWCNN